MGILGNAAVFTDVNERYFVDDAMDSNVLVRKHPNGKKGQHQVVLIGLFYINEFGGNS